MTKDKLKKYIYMQDDFEKRQLSIRYKDAAYGSLLCFTQMLHLRNFHTITNIIFVSLNFNILSFPSKKYILYL